MQLDDCCCLLSINEIKKDCCDLSKPVRSSAFYFFYNGCCHSELDGIPCEYKILEKLGEGGFSKVYKCERIMNGNHDIFVLT